MPGQGKVKLLGAPNRINQPLPPAVIVHGARDIAQALAPNLPVTLLSAPGAVLYAGCLWWRALLARADYTGPSLLDCAVAPGRAVEALALGLPGLVLAPCPAWDEVAALAAQGGAMLLAHAPPALDLAQKGAQRRLKQWLAG